MEQAENEARSIEEIIAEQAAKKPEGVRVVGDLFKEHVKQKPDAEAFIFNDRRITWKEYDLQTDRVAQGLLNLGVKKGDRVGIYMPSWPEYLFTYLGSTKIGATAVPVSWRFTPDEIKFVINNSGSSVLVMSAGYRDMDMLKNLQAVRDDLPSLKHIIVLEEDKALPGMIAFDKFITNPKPELDKAKEAVELEDPVIFIYTSGTTGVPKAAILTHKNLLAYVNWMINICYILGDNTVLMNGPLNHVGGAVMGVINCLASGNRLVMMDVFDPVKTLEIIQKEKVTVLGQVPAMYALELLNPDVEKYDLSSIILAIVSSSPCPSELITAIQKRMGVTPQNAYGLTEVSGAVTCTRIEDGEEKLKYSVGAPQAGIELSIKGDDGNAVPHGEVGEICIKGDAVMKGYWQRPDEDAKVFDKEGFFHTGDMGKLDAESCLTIVGRKKEMFIRGGENVYPPEIEEALAQHPDVFLAAVIGRPDPVMGEVGRAYIMPRPGTNPTAEGIKAFLKDKLVKYKIPEDIIFRTELPLTPVGKIKKIDLIQEMKKEFSK
ncbi:MAG: acyl--CoA ligase [Dehalococcoidia bacterium]|nr:acyl--CoA ligase [Dehalococcoidia bacterium]